jgi:hypothetical protein
MKRKILERMAALMAVAVVISGRPGSCVGAEVPAFAGSAKIRAVDVESVMHAQIDDTDVSLKHGYRMDFDVPRSDHVGRSFPRYASIRFELCIPREPGSLDKLCRERRVKAFDPHPRQPYAYLRWGSPGVTVGGRAQVQAIIVAATSGPNGSEVEKHVRRCFGDEYGALRALLRSRGSEAGALVRQIARIKARRNSWHAAFACLGNIPEIRTAYDAETGKDGVLTYHSGNAVAVIHSNGG